MAVNATNNASLYSSNIGPQETEKELSDIELLALVSFDKYYKVSETQGQRQSYSSLRERRYERKFSEYDYGQFLDLLRTAHKSSKNGASVYGITTENVHGSIPILVHPYLKKGQLRLHLMGLPDGVFGNGAGGVVHMVKDISKGCIRAQKQLSMPKGLTRNIQSRVKMIDRIHDAIAATSALLSGAAYSVLQKGENGVLKLAVLMDRPLFIYHNCIFMKSYQPLDLFAMSAKERLLVARDVALAMDLLLKAGFANTDLKVPNIMWRPDLKRAVLIDLDDVCDLKDIQPDNILSSITHRDPEAAYKKSLLDDALNCLDLRICDVLNLINTADPALEHKASIICGSHDPQTRLDSDQLLQIQDLLLAEIGQCALSLHHHSLATTLFLILMPSLIDPTNCEDEMEPFLINVDDDILFGLDWPKLCREYIPRCAEYKSLDASLQELLMGFFLNADVPLADQMVGLPERLASLQ